MADKNAEYIIKLEPKRSIIPDDYHKTHEYIILKDVRKGSEKDNALLLIQESLDECEDEIRGMCGVSVTYPDGRTDDFFITVNADGKMEPWK